MAGFAGVVVAVGAWRLGLDNNPVMGPRRILLLLVGIGLLLVVHRRRFATLLQRAAPQLNRPSQIDALREGGTRTEPHGEAIHPASRLQWLPLVAILPPILALYLWLVTAGEWTKPLPETTFYYDMLAEAFASGQTFLEQAPDQRLAQMENPYDPAQRSGIPRCRPRMTSDCILWDASYFEGKYYLYWGPAPGAGLALLKIASLGRISDSAIAFIAAGALFCLLAYCILDLWHRFFSRLPGWLLLPALVLVGLAYPLPWVLDAPRIYEAAILVAGAFLLAGLAIAIPVLASGDKTPGRLVLVGGLWGLSFASRAVLGLPIAVLATATAWRMFRTRADGSRRGPLLKPLAALVLPLALAMSLIGAYNFARFSNPLEFGWRFALGPPAGQSADAQATFDWRNIPANAYNYLFGPASFSGEFPFIKPRVATNSVSVGGSGPFQIPRPDPFYGEYVTGLLVSTPFLSFAVYLLWWLTCGSIDCAKGDPGRTAGFARGQTGLPDIIRVLLLASLAAFIPILSLYAVTARYLLDVSPILTIVACLGAWTLYVTGGRTQLARLLIGALIIATAAASATVSILLALTGSW